MKTGPAAVKPGVIFTLWAGAVFGLLLFLARIHATPLAPPPALALAQDPAPAEAASSWHVIHFLVPGCVCSMRVAEYLAHRGPLAEAAEEADEQVVILGQAPDMAALLASAGWRVSSADPGSPAAHGVGSGPWLLILDPAGRSRYSGGYLGRQIASAQEPFQDRAVLDRLRRGETVTPFGAFGCLASREASGKSVAAAVPVP